MAVENRFITVDRSMNSRNVSLLFTARKKVFSGKRRTKGNPLEENSFVSDLDGLTCWQQFSFSVGQKARKVIDQSIEAE